ncbi:MAG: response regulator transcription factor [Bacteroidales bacterium]|nr:response regulator transcription factor [Bacteroidales bacterium]
METRYKATVQQKQLILRRNQITMLILVILLITLVLLFIIWRNSMIRKRNEELATTNKNKDELLSFIAKDLYNEDFNQQIRSSLRGFEGMDEEEIHQRVAALLPRSGQMADEVASYVARLVAEKKKTGSKIGLTAREKEIVLLSAEGLSSAKIAEKLFISVHTVNNHKQNIYAKMGVKSNSEMIHQATKLGLI